MDWFDVTLRWYLVTTVATLALAPITLLLCRRLTDRGASLIRPLSALFLIWPAWFLAHLGDLVPYSGITLWVVAIVGGAGGWYLAWRQDLLDRDTITHIAIAEAAHLAAFAAFLWFRGYGPQANLQEKPSDLMMFSSVMHSSSMPPSDAWLAGEPVNYYYLGYAIWGGFGSMAGATPAETFNLALTSVFAMTLVAVAGVVANVLARYYGALAARIGGGVAALFLAILGNPWSAGKVLGDASGQWNMDETNPFGFFNGIGWLATRIIVDDPVANANPISEFPAFSFILGDPHPHLLALPFTVTALGLAWMLLSLRRHGDTADLIRRDGWRIALAGASIGALYVLNSWDFPTYLLIALIAYVAGTVGVIARERIIGGAILVLSSMVAWLPFYLHFDAPARATGSPFSQFVDGIPVIGGVLGSIAAYQGERTTPQDYLAIFGFMYLVAIALILSETWRRRDGALTDLAESRGGEWQRDPASTTFAVVTAALCFLGSLIVPAPLLVICGLPVIVIWLLMERDIRVTPANIALILFAFAMILTLIPEFFYLADIYSTRMNTIFKVYYQVWVLMAIASALAAVSIWKTLRASNVARYALPAALALVLAAGLAYPVVAGKQWLDWRAPEREWKGVDGLAYLVDEQGGRYAGEYGAIQWLLDNAGEDDVILTAGGGEWSSELGRVSSGSGVPTLIGWTGHEDQWHLGDPGYEGVAAQRTNAINELYSGPPSPELLDQYGITLIYIGPTETSGIGEEPRPGWSAPGPFPAASDPDYPGDGWTEVFNEDGSRIYRRDGT